MVIKLLALLISNVFDSFSVLLCCRSLAQWCDLKGGIEQRTNLVPVSALERKGAAIEWEETRSSTPALEPKEPGIECASDQAHSISTRYSCVALAFIASSTALWVFRAIMCAWAHFLQSSTHKVVLERIACNQVHPWPGNTLNFAYK